MRVKNQKMWCAFRFGMNSLITKSKISHMWAVHVAVRQCAKLLKITLSQVFCMFCNTSKSQNNHR